MTALEYPLPLQAVRPNETKIIGKNSQDPSAAEPQPNLGVSPAKHALSNVEGDAKAAKKKQSYPNFAFLAPWRE